MNRSGKAGPEASEGGAPTDLETPFAHDPEAVLDALGVDLELGLSSDQVQRRRARHGPNRLRRIPPRSPWRILWEQVCSLIMGLLLAAAGVSLAFGEVIDAAAIAVVIVINTAIGFFTELRAVRSMEALQGLGQVESTVRRDGKNCRLGAERLVPADIVVLRGGDVVAADLRLLEASRLEADESPLTGESVPVAKSVTPVDPETPLADRASMVFKGTAIIRGGGEGVVVATGMATEIGRISALVEQTEGEETPLEQRLDQLGQRLVWVTLGIAAAIMVAGTLAGREPFLMVQTGIALAVAAIPEGLPIVATLALARGMWQMLRRNALIRRLSSVETLGATSIICTDKTGTLTENRMSVQRLVLTTGTVAVGDQEERSGSLERDGQDRSPALDRALQIAVLCNGASLCEGGEQVVGDPLEGALLDLGRRAGLTRQALLDQTPEVRREAFDQATRMMATFHRQGGGCLVAVKGAPEAVLGVSTRILDREGVTPLTEADRQAWEEQNRRLAERGLRVVALAYKEAPDPQEAPYRGLIWVGLVGLQDPPRQGVREAIALCQRAGIRVVMVTGDQPATARSIASAVGLMGDTEAAVIHGSELADPAGLSEAQRRRIVENAIFARVEPEQKLALIDLHQRQGAIVAMTGDGVNDAPALKSADIGVAMGQRGTQVARDTADMVLQDDAFSTIVAAVAEGRVIFANLRKFVLYLLSGNVGEVLAVALATLAAAPLPLLPLQILYLNMLNDVFPALALGLGGGQRFVMDHPPRHPKEPIIGRLQWALIVGYGGVISATLLAAFAIALGWLGMENTGAVSVAFLTLSLSRLLHVFNMRDPDSGLLRNEISRNPFVWSALAVSVGLLLLAVYLPPLAAVLQVTAPGPVGWTLVLAASGVPLLLGQLYLSRFRA